MTLITIAAGVRILRRHPDRDVLIVEGLGEYATLFIESIPGGWCVVDCEAARKASMSRSGGAKMRAQLMYELEHVAHALEDRIRPGQTPESAIAQLIGDLEACKKERDELSLALLAEQGDIEGAPNGWKRTDSMWFRPLGPVNHQVEVRCSTIHPTGEPYHWTLYTPTLTAEGYAPHAREAMMRADKAFQDQS